MLATELLFVYIYCLVDDAIKAGTLLFPRRPGPAPACTDAELLTIALVRHLPATLLSTTTASWAGWPLPGLRPARLRRSRRALCVCIRAPAATASGGSCLTP